MESEFTDRLLATVRSSAAPSITEDSTQDPQAILHAAYAAIIRGDFDAFGEWVTDDVEFNLSGFGPMEGSWRGRTEVVAATRRNFALVDAQQPEVDGMISQGDSAAILLRESGKLKSTGETYRIRGVQWFTFANGKIRKIDEVISGWN
jgi:ketosteroid isomerase-like protein